MRHMSQKRFFGLFLSLMIAAGFFAGTGCKPDPEDNCTGIDNATTPAPGFAAVDNFTTVFGANNDPADIYYPCRHATIRPSCPWRCCCRAEDAASSIIPCLQPEVAKYGFIVAVPNHYHEFKLGPIDTDGLFSEGTQMQDYIDYMKAQNDNSSSPFYQKVDTGKLMMLGHSYGAACTIYAMQNNCMYPFCPEDEAAAFKRPEELKAAALCGINTKPRGKPFDYTDLSDKK